MHNLLYQITCKQITDFLLGNDYFQICFSRLLRWLIQQLWNLDWNKTSLCFPLTIKDWRRCWLLEQNIFYSNCFFYIQTKITLASLMYCLARGNKLYLKLSLRYFLICNLICTFSNIDIFVLLYSMKSISINHAETCIWKLK